MAGSKIIPLIYTVREKGIREVISFCRYSTKKVQTRRVTRRPFNREAVFLSKEENCLSQYSRKHITFDKIASRTDILNLAPDKVRSLDVPVIAPVIAKEALY